MQISLKYSQINLRLLSQLKSLALNLENSLKSEKFSEILEQIISSSNLSGDEEIKTVAVLVKTVNDLITFNTVSADEVQDLLVDTIRNMEDHLRDKEKINSELVMKLKTLESRRLVQQDDFIIDDSLKLLYVDSDEFAQYTVQENYSDSLTVIPCHTGKDAIEKLANVNFDVVLCELNLQDVNPIKLIEQHSSKFPIIAISSYDDPDRIGLALKAGAVDFIVKKNDSLKHIPRIVNSAYSTWKESLVNQSENIELLKDPACQVILKNLVSSPSPITEKIISKTIFENNQKEIELSINKLAELCDDNLLIKEPIGVRISCPYCMSENIIPEYSCQNCSSNNFSKQKLIEHYKCGNVSSALSFANDECPVCNKEIRALGVDYKVIDDCYICNDCRHVSAELNQEFLCNNCEKPNFKIYEAAWNQFYQYSVNQEKLDSIKENMVSLDSLSSFLSQRGFEISSTHQKEVECQNCYGLELVAKKDAYQIVISIFGSSVEANMSKLAAFDTFERNSNGMVSKFGIVLHDPGGIVRMLLEKYKIIPIIISQESEILDRFRENLPFNI